MSPTDRTSRFAPWIAAAACIACLAPFAGKAFHIDEPLFLWCAKHIQSHPGGDPFGFTVNWDLSQSAQPMWQVTQNPPLACYYAAGAAAVVGWDEAALHGAFLLPAVGLIWGTCRLAGRLGAPPLAAALLTLLTPAFLITGASVTSDVPMLCGWVWAVLCWDMGVREQRAAPMYAAALLGVVAFVTKYFAASLIPLLAAYALALDRRRWRRWLPPLAVAAAGVIAYQLVTRAVYGRGLFAGAAAYALDFAPNAPAGFGQRLVITLAFLGGGAGAPLFLLPWALSWRRLLVTVPVTVVITLACVGTSVPWWQTAQVVLWSALGIELLAVAVAELASRRDAAALLVLLWLAGTVYFAAFLNHSVNGRSVLPALPAVGILLAWRLDRRAGTRPILPLVFAAALALLPAWADLRLADVQRASAEQIAAEYGRPDHTLWFHGHWGWQYYLERAGGRPWDTSTSQAVPGDFIALPDNNIVSAGPPTNSIATAAVLELPACGWLGTMNGTVGAGFYSHFWGPLPFVFGPAPPERFEVVRVTRSFGAAN